ncbi:MAG TPA: DUF4388 domain-containing protein [Blastocatellia bacterium]|nr:DUF4388 domain-containing protein [Blastocatellia bacterium]
MSLEGDLKEFSLIGVMQIICMEHRRAGLHVSRRGEEATILFDGGDIVHAALGSLQGEEAVYQLLTWTEGSFRTTDHITIVTRNVFKNWNHLLIEGMRRIDERRKDSFDQPSVRLSRQDAERDSRLENDLIMLLSSLEHTMSRLNDKKAQKRPAQAVEILADIVNAIAAFSEGLRGVDPVSLSLRVVTDSISKSHPFVRSISLQGNRISLEAGSGQKNGWKNMFPGRQSDLRQTASALVAILERYFSAFAELFLSPSARDQSRETYEVFVADLKTNLSRVEF